jgi:hypothetical protein
MGQEGLGRYVVTNNLNQVSRSNEWSANFLTCVLQAIYVLSREHVVDLEERCDFLSKPGKNKFYQALRK